MTASEQTDRRSLMKEALLEIDRLQAELDAHRQAQHAPIAIIGLGCRFPGAENPSAFWRLLADGVDAIREVPADRWDIAAYYDPDPDSPGKMATRFGGFIEDVDRFDANFFNIAPCEAECMDPQQRLLLEVSWEALEHAGVSPHDLLGSETGVFLGICHSDYVKLLSTTEPGTLGDEYRGTGNALSVAAGRLSYFLGLRGPSLAVDTACSSSLVATHLAVSSLRKGECRAALVGGVNLMLDPDQTICFSNAHMLAPDGRCKTFDAAADGYVRGEGCGVVVLKRLADALADGDNVLAVIRGSAVNQDGRSAGLTAPNGPSQEAVIREALADAGIQPQQVDYVEAHGTGTSLGDPIEVHALARAIALHRSADAPLSLGSVKTNLGHLEAAAGIAGLIKLVLALQHNEVPPHLHFSQLNPHISVNDVPIRISRHRSPWTSGQHGPRIGGVSSFGFGGTNAHVLVSEAPPAENGTAPRTRPLQLLVLSAKSHQALKDLAVAYQHFLSAAAKPMLQEVCYAAAVGRAHHHYRLAVIEADRQEAADSLKAFIQGRQSPGLMRPSSEPKQSNERVVFASSTAKTAETQPPSYRVVQAVSNGAPAQVWRQHLEEIARLYVEGADLDWRGFYNHVKRTRVQLPTYPFQRERYWIEDAELLRPNGARQIDRHRGKPSAAATKPALLGYRINSPLPIFELVLNTQAIPALKEHLILQRAVVPASLYVHMALLALQELFGSSEFALADVEFRQMLVLDDRLCTLQLVLQTVDGVPTDFQLYSARESEPEASGWTLSASGKVASGAAGATGGVPLSDLRFRLREKVDMAGFYDRLCKRGVEYGPAFQCLDQVSRRDGETLGRLRVPQAVQREATACPLHPVLLAAALPLVAVSLPTETRDADDQRPFVPTRLASLNAHRDLTADGWVHVRTRQLDAETIEADLRMLDDSGKPVVQISGLRLERLGTLAGTAARQDTSLVSIQPPSTLTNVQLTEAPICREELLSGDAARQRESIEAYLQKLFATALRIDESQLAVDRPLHQLGIDSLMIAKLGTRLQRELNVFLELGELMERPSVAQLATLVIDKITQPQTG